MPVSLPACNLRPYSPGELLPAFCAGTPQSILSFCALSHGPTVNSTLTASGWGAEYGTYRLGSGSGARDLPSPVWERSMNFLRFELWFMHIISWTGTSALNADCTHRTSVKRISQRGQFRNDRVVLRPAPQGLPARATSTSNELRQRPSLRRRKPHAKHRHRHCDTRGTPATQQDYCYGKQVLMLLTADDVVAGGLRVK